ncbi:aromatic ring-hydroxylating oxygenase subunit alpha [Mycolicibacterium chitae]|uniref:aromatic ring-hydroxylating oxygenase subunit alpha n=1 Tax=Mycolicibacterium chitae TaxID=1792 RepID=UPI0018D7D6C6|nr:aromatic ring-hydroxylating dioxygenase subunit alpha [Mycolicibacterium chitae]
MWKKAWQFACREEDIPEAGDYLVYDVADLSLIVVRTEGGDIKAYHNACLHRGTRLCDDSGHANQLRCPFHGFTWSLDGALTDVPCRWDFPHVRAEEFGLPEAQTGLWAGFVFVNPDPGAESLETYLGDLDKHFAPFALQDRFKAIHVAKVIDCNWKVGMEAFLESYHVIATHPQLLEYLGDSNTQYDVYSRADGLPGFNRMITPQATSSPHLEPLEPQDVLDAMFRDFYPDGWAPSRSPRAPRRARSSPRPCARTWPRPPARTCRGPATRRSWTPSNISSSRTWCRGPASGRR